MTAQVVTSFEAPADSRTMAPKHETQTRGGLFPRARKFVVFLWKYLAGMILCQTALGSVLVVGWTYRLCRRSILKRWWKASRIGPDEESFAAFLERTQPLERHRPNWVVRQNFLPEFSRRLREAPGLVGKTKCLFTAFFGSLGANFKLGLQAILNTWVLTVPGCALWLVAWYDGWNNSFNKGYEQAAVGPTTGVCGVLLFIAAMLYVPMAQARQASTGSWRSFYQFRLVWGLIKRNRLKCLGLAMLYSVVSLTVTILKTVPGFFTQMFPNIESMTDAEILSIAQTYFFWAAAAVFPAYVLLHLAAARIYSRALVAGIHEGRIQQSELGSVEVQALAALDLLYERDRPQRHPIVRVAGRGANLTIGTVLTILCIVVWFTFVAQIFVSEFLNYHPGVGWLNQPLVQLPWFHYVPGHLSP